MFDDVDSHKKARANLILISMAVLLYIFGEGKFGGAGILGGSIKFDNPYALPTAGILIFYFLVWRYLLSVGNALKEFNWEFHALFYTSKTYIRIRDEWLKDKEIPAQNKTDFIERSIFSQTKFGDTGYFPPQLCGEHSFYPSHLAYVIHVPFELDRRSDFPFKCDSKNIYIGEIPRLDSFKIMLLLVYCLHKAILFRRSFTDVVFPFMIGYIATIVLTHKIASFIF